MSGKFLVYLVKALVYFTFLSFAGSDQVSKASLKLIQLRIGSDVALSWCVPEKISTEPDAIFYIKDPSCTDAKMEKCAIAKKSGEDVSKPTNSFFKSLFSQDQLSVLETNCTTNDEKVPQTNFTLVIRNLSISQDKTYGFIADYPGKILRQDNETKLEFYVQPSIILNSTKHAVVGENVTLNCTASGIPTPTIKWTKIGSNVVLSTESLLTFDSITKEQNGTYVCTAANLVGNPKEAQIDLNIYYPPTTINLTTSVRESFVGQKATLHCSADGNPKPTYFWILPNNSRIYSHLVNKGPSTLSVLFNSSDDFGNYTCVVNNSLGSVNSTTAIKQLFRPGKIGNLLNRTGVNSVNLNWTAPHNGGSKILNYLVQVTGENTQEMYNKTSTTCYINDLSKKTSYEFCVSARNIVGLGEKRCIETITLWKGPPERPEGVVLRRSTNKEGVITVSWESVGGSATYILKYRQKSPELSEWIIKNLTDPAVLIYEISGLKPGTNYEVVILSKNKHGQSIPSEPRNITIPHKPTTSQSSIITTSFNPEVNNEESKGSNKTTIIVIAVLLALLVIVAVIFFILWMKRRSGRDDHQDARPDHVPGPLNSDLYATVDTKKPTKKEKNKGDLVYAELSEIAPAVNEHKPPSYEPTDYADITHFLTPNADEPSQEGTYANIAEINV